MDLTFFFFFFSENMLPILENLCYNLVDGLPHSFLPCAQS